MNQGNSICLDFKSAHVCRWLHGEPLQKKLLMIQMMNVSSCLMQVWQKWRKPPKQYLINRWGMGGITWRWIMRVVLCWLSKSIKTETTHPPTSLVYENTCKVGKLHANIQLKKKYFNCRNCRFLIVNGIYLITELPSTPLAWPIEPKRSHLLEKKTSRWNKPPKRKTVLAFMCFLQCIFPESARQHEAMWVTLRVLLSHLVCRGCWKLVNIEVWCS